jgi:hypothetical protein
MALALVLIYTTLILSIWSVANRQTVDLVRLKERLWQREMENQEVRCRRLALAYGLALLETGRPPSDPYECEAVVQTPSGSLAFVVRFESVGGQSKWQVSARLKEGTDPSNLPRPTRFAPP